MKMVIGLIFSSLAIFAITNPSADAHKEKLHTEASKASEKAVGSTDNNFFSQALRSVAKMMARGDDGRSDEPAFRIPQLYVCSTGSVEFNGKQHTVTRLYPRQCLFDECRQYGEGAEYLPTISISRSRESNVSLILLIWIAQIQKTRLTAMKAAWAQECRRNWKRKPNQAFDKAADKVSKKGRRENQSEARRNHRFSSIEKIIDQILELF